MNYTTDAELYAIYLSHPTVQIDSRRVGAGDLFFGLPGSRVHGNQHAAGALEKGAAYVVVDDAGAVPEGEEAQYLLVPDTLSALQGLAVSHRRANRLPTLAITGSNGKTTTKELIRAVMSRQYRVHATPGNYNNHIGLPLTVLGMPTDTEMLILEMGANHQGEIGELCLLGQPTHGIITNIGEAHLEGFGGIEGVIAGKGELFDYLSTHRGVAFVNKDEEYLSKMANGVNRVIYFEESETPSKDVAAMEIQVRRVHPTIEVGFLNTAGELVETEVALSGRHNLQNVKAAIAIGKYFKVPSKEIAAALAAYRPNNSRSQTLVAGGVDFYWDAYNANPSSVMAALNSFATNVACNNAVVILGEMLELGDVSADAHRRVSFRAGQVADTVVLVGAAMEAPAREFERPWFPDSRALADWFWRQDWSGKTVFVKGSRGNRLEQLLEQVTQPARQ